MQELGQIVHGYRLDNLLGSGGMGEVFSGTHVASGRRVALKTVRFKQTDYQRALFTRESQVQRRVRHPAIAQLLDFFIEDGQAFIVSELIENGTPLQVWQKCRSQSEVLGFYALLAEGVGALHAQGLVHRDLKPQNVLVVEEQSDGGKPAFRPVILDFGLAVVRQEPDNLTGVGTTVGTPIYLAPESIRGEVAGPGVDVFALGVMLTEALGAPELMEAGESLYNHLSRRQSGDFPPAFRSWLPDLRPRGLTATITSMLARDPEERPSASRVAISLREVATGISASWLDLPASRSPHWRRPRVMAMLFGASILLAGVVALSILTPPLKLGNGANLQGAGWLMLGLAGFALLTVAIFHARKQRQRALATQVKDESLARRIVAIEEKIQTSAAMTESLVLGLQEVSRQVDEDRLTTLVRASVLVALQDFETAREVPPKKVTELVAMLRKSADSSKAEAPKKRIAALFGVFASGVAVLAGVVGLLTTTNLWHPGRPPQISSFGPPEIRLTKGAPTFLSVAASDPDGEHLTYSFRASAGHVEGRGNSVLWTPPASLPERLVELTVAVRNRSHTIEAARSLVVNAPPVIELSIPLRAARRSVMLLRAVVRDPDGDATKVTWKVSCGELLGAGSETLFWRAPDQPCHAVVVCEADDGWERRSATASINVD